MIKSVNIGPLTFDAAYEVATRMRPEDAREIFACRWNDRLEDLALDALSCAPLAWEASFGGEPVAAYGVAQMRPGVVGVWLYATEKWPKVALSVTRHAKKAIHPALIEAGIHRAECHSIEGHDVAHLWLTRALGMIKEAVHPGFGRRAETFFTFAWTARNVQRP